MDIQDYRRAIQADVCVPCTDSDGRGNCRIDPVCECTVQQHLPLIIEMIKSVRSGDMNDYVRVLRNAVCARCSFQTVNGYCTARMNLDCALDRYLSPVIGAILEVKETGVKKGLLR